MTPAAPRPAAYDGWEHVAGVKEEPVVDGSKIAAGEIDLVSTDSETSRSGSEYVESECGTHVCET